MFNGPAVYLVRNNVTDEVYIGSTGKLRKRFETHVNRLRGNRSHSPIFQNSWNKYGESAFTFEVLEVYESKDELLSREQFWMDALLPELNSKPFAANSTGAKMPESAKVKLRELRLNQPCPRTGKLHSDESKEKMRNAKSGVERGSYNMGCTCGTCITCKRRAYATSYYERHRNTLTTRRMNRYHTQRTANAVQGG